MSQQQSSQQTNLQENAQNKAAKQQEQVTGAQIKESAQKLTDKVKIFDILFV